MVVVPHFFSEARRPTLLTVGFVEFYPGDEDLGGKLHTACTCCSKGDEQKARKSDGPPRKE